MQVTKHSYSYDVFASVGAASLQDFRQQFQRLHEQSPLRAIKLFLFYLVVRGVDPIAHCMAFWATSGTTYISLLLEPDLLLGDGLSAENEGSALRLLGKVDPQFLFKFARSVAVLKDPVAISRALTLTPELGDYSILLPWLRTLVQTSEPRIRNHSAKLLCQLRPNKGLIERHMQSPDPRMRASVMEALWHPNVIRISQDLLPVFRSALTDPNHRVVANALVGLYRIGQFDALHKMIGLCSDKKHLFRAASAWAMGVVEDARAVPALQQLVIDKSFTVRQRAKASLGSLAATNTNEYGDHAYDLEVVTV